MRKAARNKPPFLLRLLVRLESWVVPAEARRAWLAKRQAELRDWWILVERGEMPSDKRAVIASHCARIFPPALWMRFSKEHLRWWLRGPVFPLAAACAVLLCITSLTGGLAYTRFLARLVMDVYAGGTAAHGGHFPEVLIGHLYPLAFALLISGALFVKEFRVPARSDWRYWGYLAVKTLFIQAVLVIGWIEAGAAIRAHFPYGSHEMVTAMAVLTVSFILLFGRTAVWSLEDQPLRCPVCLHLLALPVRIGSWGSMLEPATTEMVCQRGHGTLVVIECGDGVSDRWVELDESWSELFEVPVR